MIYILVKSSGFKKSLCLKCINSLISTMEEEILNYMTERRQRLIVKGTKRQEAVETHNCSHPERDAK